MTIGILEITAITTPKRLLRFLDEGSASFNRLVYYRINFRLGLNVMRKRKRFESVTFGRYSCILS